jgi:diguanylate cyclase (GGDEF)-like protein
MMLAMADATFTVLLSGAADAAWSTSAQGPFSVTPANALDGAGRFDAVVCVAPKAADLRSLARRADLQQAAFDAAVVVLTSARDPAAELLLLQLGVQDIVVDPAPEAAARAIRHAIERKRLEQAARNAYATDLATGLPHQAQLLEHMTQLLALRERDPAPMGLIVLRVEGLASTAARMGAEAANILRRKVAVRLRGALRASDVVAAIGPDSFGILLSHIEAPTHGERVAAKLQRSLQQPFQVAGQSTAVAAAVGLALYPEHGKDAKSLLQRAGAQAASVASVGREGFSSRVERGPAQAANDDGPEPSAT